MGEKNVYHLINPYIEGSVDTVVKSKNSYSAGKRLYNNISKYFTNHVEDFYMTIQNVQTNELTHFKIGEKKEGNNDVNVNFTLLRINDNFAPDVEQKLVSYVKKLERQAGGKKHRHHDDSPSETTVSSSESDYYKVPVWPITRFVYFRMPYYKLKIIGLSPIDSSRLFFPMFSLPINPTFEFNFDIYKY